MPDLSNSTVYSQTDANNNTGTLPTWAEGQDASQLNDSARALQGAIKRSWDRSNFTLDSTGSANAYVLTYAVAPDGYANGERYAFTASFTNSGAATLNVNSLGAKSIKQVLAGTLSALAANAIYSGDKVEVEYDSSDDCFVLVGRPNVDVLRSDSAPSITIADAATNTSPVVETITHTTSGTAAAGFGITRAAYLENASGSSVHAADLAIKWVTATAGSEDSEIVGYTISGGGTLTRVMTLRAGAYFGSPTGGDKGADSLNVSQLYQDGVKVWKTKFKTSDTTITSDASLSIDSELRVTLAANQKIHFRAVVFANAPASVGVKIGVDGPGTPNRVFANVFRSGEDNAGSQSMINGSYGAILSTTPASTSKVTMVVDGYVTNGSTAGTFGISLCQATSSATSVTIYRGSSLGYVLDAE